MRLFEKTTLAVLVAGASAQFASYSTNGITYNVNIPATTASGSGKTIFFQLVAPTGTEWIGLGQGSQMSGSNIFMVYADGNGNVTLSPRLGTGQSMPSYGSSAATVSVLAGSTSSSDGSMTANVRCDNCLSWSGGTMDPTSSSSSWIWAIKSGSAVDSTDKSESLSQHDTMGSIALDLGSGTGGSSSNPFVATADASASGGSSTASGSQTATASSSSSTTTSTSGSSSGSSSSGTVVLSSSPSSGTRVGHAVVMSIVFLVLMPFASMTLYLGHAKRVPFIHAPLQIFSIVLLIVGLALGVQLARPLGEIAAYHQIIGYIVLVIPFSIQPALGLYQHIHFRRTGGRSAMGSAHRWLGRGVMLAGAVNGGLGIMQSGPGSADCPTWVPILYSVVAVVVAIIYVSVVVGSAVRRRRNNATNAEKPLDRRGYEMQRPSNEGERRQYQQQQQQHQGQYR